MGVRSLLVHIRPGTRDAVMRALEAEPGCDVYPATNRDVVVIVSDLQDRRAEEAFDERLSTIPGVMQVALVAGFAE